MIGETVFREGRGVAGDSATETEFLSETLKIPEKKSCRFYQTEFVSFLFVLYKHILYLFPERFEKYY